MHTRKNEIPKPYPLDFTPYPPTPNHNPLINESLYDTCYDIWCVIEFLNDAVLTKTTVDLRELGLNQQRTWGLQCILNCVTQALQYEINHRPQAENKASPKE